MVGRDTWLERAGCPGVSLVAKKENKPMMLSDLRGENALVIVGTVSRLLKKIEQHFPDFPEYKGLCKRYREEAMSGDYVHLCAVTEKYVIKYLPNTLRAELGDLTEEYEDA